MVSWSDEEALQTLPAALEDKVLAVLISIPPADCATLQQALQQMAAIYGPPSHTRQLFDDRKREESETPPRLLLLVVGVGNGGVHSGECAPPARPTRTDVCCYHRRGTGHSRGFELTTGHRLRSWKGMEVGRSAATGHGSQPEEDIPPAGAGQDDLLQLRTAEPRRFGLPCSTTALLQAPVIVHQATLVTASNEGK
ncbi:unnamed protein product [Lampetra planeri]